MIIGNGMLARAFAEFEDRDDVIVFASGTANSLETDQSVFDREVELLCRVRAEHSEIPIVYFSTCSVADPDRRDTEYVRHKIGVEKLLHKSEAPYLVVRLPVVIGENNLATTFPFYIRDQIINARQLTVWKNAIRFPIDIDDVVKMCSSLINDRSMQNGCVEIALRAYDVPRIVSEMELVLGRTAIAECVDTGQAYSLDLEIAHELADSLEISYDDDYLARLLRKYFSPVSGLINSDNLPERPTIAGGVPYRQEAERIVYGAPLIGEAEISAVADCMRSRWIGLGPRVHEFETAFAEYKGATYATAMNSGSAALHLALLALGIGEGDEVIVPTMTFCASAHAVIHAGATPVLVDCERSTYNIDTDLIERSITDRTKAIMVVHIGGRCCDMRTVMSVARKHGLRIVEDCAHAIETQYFGAAAGLLGDVGCFSFYATKSITTADGGMLITNDESIHKKVQDLVLHGLSSDAWTRSQGNAANYVVVTAGYKYNMTDIEASIGLVQLRGVEERWERRRRIWQVYDSMLSGLPLVTPPPVEDGTRHGYHLYSIVVDIDKVGISVGEIIRAMKAEFIGVGIHYVPVHNQYFYANKYGFLAEDFPNANYIGNRTLSLPLNADLSDRDIQDVCNALRRILEYYSLTSEDAHDTLGRRQELR